MNQLLIAFFILCSSREVLAQGCVMPALISLVPGSGNISGGANFTLTGQGFCNGVTVDFGSMQAIITSQTATQIIGKIPANAPGSYPVIVNNPGVAAVALGTGFTYIAPSGGLVASAGPALFAGTGQSLSFFGYVAGGTPPYTYFWNFGDGASGNQKTGTHTYQVAKTYAVTFIVVDSQNYISFSTTTAYVSGPITNFLLDDKGQPLTDGAGGKLLAQ